MMTVTRKIGTALVALSLAAPVLAAEKKKVAPAAQPDAAMMEMMQKYGMPGAAHKVLEPVVGTWATTVRGWMKPGDKPQESMGTGENSWVFGGRFLKQEFKGTWAGQPFEGLGYTGHNNMKGQYESIWLDNMSTSMMMATGTYDAVTKTLNQGGTFTCPMTGEKDKWYRSEWKIIDNDNNTYTSYFKDETGKEFKAMEIIYKRIK